MLKMAVFWFVAPFSLVEVYRRFRGTCCLHHQGYQTTRANNPEDSPEDSNLRTSRRENLKFQALCFLPGNRCFRAKSHNDFGSSG
jgi:hypothetical protein